MFFNESGATEAIAVTAGPKTTSLRATCYKKGTLCVFSIVWNGSCTNKDNICSFSIGSHTMVTSYSGGTIQQGTTTSAGLYIVGAGNLLQQSSTNACTAGTVTGCFLLN